MRARGFGVVLLWFAGVAHAQPVVRADEVLDADRPEAWAMQYLAAAALPAGYGAAPPLAPGRWELAAEFAHIPALDTDQRRVGFDGTKVENLNTAPLVGRVRAGVGLPGRFRLEAGWTPPLAIDGARPHALFSLALARPLVARVSWSLHARAFAQHGSVTGDFTCPRELAGVADPQRNPYGCEAASHDRFRLRQRGLEAQLAWTRGRWTAHAALGAMRNDASVQVDALTAGVRDRSRLDVDATRPFVALGAERAIGAHWRASLHWLRVPLDVRRGTDAPRERDDYGAVRVALAWRP
jgi:hypothetical protein